MSGFTNPQAPDLGRREAELLASAVELYLDHGEPVSSRALSERSRDGLSSATVRNVLATLESGGLLYQPHTSAGRIPTPQAIRWWLQLPSSLPEQLPAADVGRLVAALQRAGDDTAVWREATQFLADFTHQLGLAATVSWNEVELKQIHFLRLTDHRVLAVLVAADGQVRERSCRVPECFPQPELDAAARFLNLHFAGRALSNIRRELLQRVTEERAAYDALLRRVLVLYHCGVLELHASGEVYFQGAAHLAESLEPERLAAMLETLQEKERWLRLLNQMEQGGDLIEVEGVSPSPTLARRLRIRVRVDLASEQLPGMALISASCSGCGPGSNPNLGSIAILGPSRMAYRRALSAVALVGHVLGRVLGEN